MKDPPSDDPWGRIAPGATAALAAAVLAVLGFGAFPGPLVDWARRAALSLLSLPEPVSTPSHPHLVSCAKGAVKPSSDRSRTDHSFGRARGLMNDPG